MMPDDERYATVTISCPVCHCDEVYPTGWDIAGEFLRGYCAKVANGDEPLGRKRPICMGCPCHSGIGLLPHMKVRVA